MLVLSMVPPTMTLARMVRGAPSAETKYVPHCHSASEEIFVILEGSGTFHAGDEQHDVRAGHAVSRRPGTGVAHWFVAGEGGMTQLAYGTREPNDIVHYPASGEVLLCGVGVTLKTS